MRVFCVHTILVDGMNIAWIWSWDSTYRLARSWRLKAFVHFYVIPCKGIQAHICVRKGSNWSIIWNSFLLTRQLILFIPMKVQAAQGQGPEEQDPDCGTQRQEEGTAQGWQAVNQKARALTSLFYFSAPGTLTSDKPKKFLNFISES